MSTTTTTTTTTRDRGDRYGPMEWAQLMCVKSCIGHTETKTPGERHVGVQFIVVDAGTAVARAHAEPILVEVVGTRLTPGAR